MKRTYVLAALGFVVGGVFGVASCAEEGGSTPPKPLPDSAVTDTTPGGDTGPGDDTSTEDTTNPPDGTPSDGGKCPATLREGKIAELRDPASPKKVIVNDGVKMTGVVATSIKFRTRNPSKAGDPCLFSVFVADANATFQPWSGVQLISYGANAVLRDGGGVTCPPGTDHIPDDIKPGDLLDASGTYTEFGPTADTCGKATPPLPPPTPGKNIQIRLCELAKKGTGTLPAPADVTPIEIADGGSGLPKYIGGRLRIKNVTAGSDIAFGGFLIEGSKLEVNNVIYYRGAATSPTVKKGDKFDEIVGLSYLDFCTWALAPTVCTDMKPAAGSLAKCPTPAGDAGSDAAGD